MAFKPVGAKAPATAAAPAKAAPAKRIRPASTATQSADTAAEPEPDPANAPSNTAADAAETAAEAPAKPAGIARAADRNKAPAEIKPAAAREDDDDPLAWTHQGDEAQAIAEAEAARREAAAEERRARGYWPHAFELIPPGTPSKSGPINDRYQADIILLDDDVGPAFWRHILKNPRTGRWDLVEPCPKEFDNCPICPPGGERESDYVALMTCLNINGYTIKSGPRIGQHVPITKELLVPFTNDHAYFRQLAKDHGGLRGIQLTMTRSSKSDPRIGVPQFVGKFDDAQIEQFIKDQGMWKIKETQEGEKIDEEDWLMHKFNYADFLKRPSGADLRARYAGGIQNGAPVGARTAGDPQWGNSRYAPGAAGGPGAGATAGQTMDDLDDDVPF